MPKLVVLVEKDENGKLWDYAFTPNDWKDVNKLLAASPLMIHKSDNQVTARETASSTSASQDFITIGVIPRQEEVIKQRMPRSK